VISFDRIAQRLDAALAAARPHLEQRHVLVDDESNRSGFDRSGFGTPSWSFRFQRRSRQCGPVVTATATVAYDERGGVAAAWIADVFHLGYPWSLFRDEGDEVLSPETLEGDGLFQTVWRLLASARSALPPEYGAALATPYQRGCENT
jgi:hypothetical protein